MSPKILKVLLVLVAVAALKLTVLGSLGLKTLQQLQNEELLPLPMALASTPAAAGPAALAPAKEAAPAEPDMLAQAAIPGAKVQESQESSGLKRREEELRAKEHALAAMEKSVDDKLAELKRAEASIKKLLDEADSLKDARIKRQVDTYMAMKPKQAAEVLSNMDQDLAVKILTGMKPKQAGEIMTFVKTDKAAKLTEAMTRVQAPMQGPGQ
ncbi:MAG: magnesium transporter MgtE [Proteobacteria bacterium]|nr:magnesium transporter MgtE [Pseudomonadota bacterium]MBU1596627.1 magnesium transporter MgtE [Pseudomonadota bacterium]